MGSQVLMPTQEQRSTDEKLTVICNCGEAFVTIHAYVQLQVKHALTSVTTRNKPKSLQKSKLVCAILLHVCGLNMVISP